MESASKTICPNMIKQSNIPKAIRTALLATLVFSELDKKRVQYKNTGIVPIGSITEKNRIKSLYNGCIYWILTPSVIKEIPC